MPTVLVLATTLVSLTACGDSDITVDTPCKEYLQYSDGDRSEATSKLEKEYHVTGFVSVDGACMNWPWYNVGQALGVSK